MGVTMPSSMSTEDRDQDHVRLVERLKHELAEALEFQTATSKVLEIISRSPTNAQPVFDMIAESAARLCAAKYCFAYRFDGQLLHFVAHHGATAEVVEMNRRNYPAPPGRGHVTPRAILERRVVQVPDVSADTAYALGAMAAAAGYRSAAAVPILRDGMPIGAIAVTRAQTGLLPERQIQLLKTFADQAAIAIENARLFEEVQARNGELRVALEQQTATSEVLSVISRSKFNLQPVLDAIARGAARLCGGVMGGVFRYDGKLMHVGAMVNFAPGGEETWRGLYPRPATADTATGRAILQKTVVTVADVEQDRREEWAREVARTGGYRSAMAAPMLREGVAIGAVLIARTEPSSFAAADVDLLKTFADQAVIAIENTRLFEEVQARTRELTEALVRQTASAEILRVISSSPTDTQPVFDKIMESAVRLCDARYALVYRLEGEMLQLVAHHNFSPKALEPFRRTFPHRLSESGTLGAQAMIRREIIVIDDIECDSGVSEAVRELARSAGYRSVIVVPMMRDGLPLGSIALTRSAEGGGPEPFSRQQIKLLEMFAEHVGIAIENTQLFEEVQRRTRELQEALEYQTATGEVLNVISRSPSQLQPVLDTIVATASRLCEADYAVVFRLKDDGIYHVAAANNAEAAFVKHAAEHPVPPGRGSLVGRTALEGRTVHLPDCLTDPDFTYFDYQSIGNYRSMLGVPLLRDGTPTGVIAMLRRVVKPFTDKQIELVTTFADQAVIAIESTRLFEEVEARNRDLTALGEVGRAVSATLDLNVVLKTIIDRAVDLSGTDGGSIFYLREERGAFELGETSGLEEQVVAKFRKLDIAARETGLGEAIAKRQPLQVPDVTKRASNPLRDAALEAGLRAALIVPLISSEEPLGALVLQRRQPGEFSPAVVSLMQSFADQSTIALENAQLFEEIARKSRELEIASQHKSQFVANMSHELRTPLAAILGYTELIQEGFYGALPEKSMDALTRIRSNGKHLLGLINTVLDIAKIESGQFSLNLAEYALASVVETVRAATESLAETKKLALKTEVSKSLPIGFGDEQRLTQVLLNLVGNAIKFTDTGEVRITASTENGHFAVSVADTGPGIPADQLTRVFDQFHQVDNSNTKKKGGTGLGLAIAKQIVEMHGGRVWVESEVGQGATFQMQLPVRAESRKPLQ